MAISHVCMACGTELARRRARHDAALDLWLVTCPTCNTTVVRSSVRRRAARRRIRRAVIATVVACVQVGLLLASIFASVALVLVSTAELDAYGRDPALVEFVRMLRDREGVAIPIVVYLVVTGTAVGVWLRAGLGHWRFWTAWLVWTALLLAVLSLPEVNRIVGRLYWRLGGWEGYRGVRFELFWIDRAQVAMLLAVIAFITMPLGTLGRRLWTSTRSARISRLLKRQRAARGRQ